MTADCVKYYGGLPLRLDDLGRIMDDDDKDAGAELVARAKRYMLANPSTTFVEALHRIRTLLPDGGELICQHNTSLSRNTRVANHNQRGGGPDVLIHNLAMERMEATSESYPDAVRAVLRERPELAKAYIEQAAAR